MRTLDISVSMTRPFAPAFFNVTAAASSARGRIVSHAVTRRRLLPLAGRAELSVPLAFRDLLLPMHLAAVARDADLEGLAVLLVAGDDDTQNGMLAARADRGLPALAMGLAVGERPGGGSVRALVRTRGRRRDVVERDRDNLLPAARFRRGRLRRR